MKNFFLLGFFSLLFAASTLSAQLQWYQNQDGQSLLPYGTSATSVHRLDGGSFIASYLWQVADEENTWKISRTTLQGQEISSFFIAGTSAAITVKVDENKAIYVLVKKYNEQQQLLVTVYKLNKSLQLMQQKSISLPGSFQFINVNAIELDATGNVYLTADTRQDTSGTTNYASFLWKLDRNLNLKWRKADQSHTSYIRLHIEPGGGVLILEDHSTLFPAVRIKRFASSGMLVHTKIVQADPYRYSLSSLMDKQGNLYIYGNKSIGDTAQAVYLQKIRGITLGTVYQRVYNTGLISQLNDVQADAAGNLFMLTAVYTFEEGDVSNVARIKANNGNYYWNRSYRFSEDSNVLSRLVVNNNSRFYVLGEKRSYTYFSKGFALQLHKQNEQEIKFISPDSVAFQKSHWLVNGIEDKDGRLIAIGNTSDFDTITYSNTYQRAFALRFHENANGCKDVDKGSLTNAFVAENQQTEISGRQIKLNLYPNPVQEVLNIRNTGNEEYDWLEVFNMQGVRVIQQTVRGNISQVDVSQLSAGAYLLVLRSFITMKQTAVKFIVKK